MKNKIKYLLLGICITIMSPMITDAAGITLEGNKNNNIATYEVKYDPTDAVETTSVKININKTNDDLVYDIKKSDNDFVLGECSNDLSCTLNLQEITNTTTIATITITNTSSESKETEISVSGTYTSDKKVFTLKPATTTTTTTTTQKVLSSDNTLSELVVSVGALDQAFNKDLTTYNVTGIKDTVNSVTITPTCGTGECAWNVTCPLGECSVTNPTAKARVNLQTGANKVSIVVTSEDRKQNKTYILNVYRGEIEASSAYLSSIKIEDAILSPNFDSMTNDYTTSVRLDVDSLDITTIAEDPSANIVIKGNENFVEGENTVTITVTSSDGENKQVYTIIVTKEELETEAEEKVDEEEKDVVTSKVEKKKNNTWLIILLSVLGLALIIVVFLIIFKNKKKKNDKNNKNDKGTPNKKNDDTEVLENKLEEDLLDENWIEKENTENLNILDETRRQLKEEPKQDIDAALDDLMQTKRLELGDLDF